MANQAQNTVGGAVSQVQDTAGQARQAASGLVHGTQETVGGLAQGTQHAASGLVQGTQQQAHRAQGQVQRLLHDNPLAVGAASLALGTAIGLVIPETQRESQVLGGARDTLMDKAVGTAQDTMQKVGNVARKAESAVEGAVKDEAHTQGLVG